MSKVNWFLSLCGLLGSDKGFEGPEDEDEESEDEDAEEGDEGDEEEEDGDEDSGQEEEEGAEEDEEDGDEDVDPGTNDGKDRSKFIPRARFDQVNTKAKKLERLVELGILEEGTDGEFHLNKEAIKKVRGADGEEAVAKPGDENDIYFKKEEVDDASWPLVEKINRANKRVERMYGQAEFAINRLFAENKVLADYPEFLQKDSPLRKKANDIIKNDPEFKKVYAGRPDAGYWAVKRAAELLAGKTPMPLKKKNKAKFIIGRGDVSRSPKKVLDFSKMSKAELDKAEADEHARINKRRQKQRV